MMYQLGPVQFELYPLNLDDVTQETGADYASKAILGRRPKLEFVGEAEETFSLTGKLFPSRFGGTLDDLRAIRLSGLCVPFTRGDGQAIGWFVIEKSRAKGTSLDADGVGKMIEFEVTLKRDDPPGIERYYSVISSLFG